MSALCHKQTFCGAANGYPARLEIRHRLLTVGSCVSGLIDQSDVAGQFPTTCDARLKFARVAVGAGASPPALDRPLDRRAACEIFEDRR
jgi:hypothetical protein